MTVALDATYSLGDDLSGVGVYSRELMAGLARAQLNEALDNVETARRELRVTMADLAMEQGASFSELGKAIGVSRQLVSQLAREARSSREGMSPDQPAS